MHYLRYPQSNCAVFRAKINKRLTCVRSVDRPRVPPASGREPGTSGTQTTLCYHIKVVGRKSRPHVDALLEQQNSGPDGPNHLPIRETP